MPGSELAASAPSNSLHNLYQKVKSKLGRHIDAYLDLNIKPDDPYLSDIHKDDFDSEIDDPRNDNDYLLEEE